MGKRKTNKLLFKDGNLIYQCLWTDVTKDGSVIIGFSSTAKFREKIIAVLDTTKIYLTNRGFKVLHEDEIAPNSKITFHKSGSIKATTKTLIEREGTDRATIQGVPFTKISEPIPMCSIILRKDFLKSKYAPTEKDLLFDITDFPDKPLHIIVSCMENKHFQNYQERRIVNVSMLESTLGLKYKNLTWAYTIWVHLEDEEYPTIHTIYIPGKISWPKRSTIWRNSLIFFYKVYQWWTKGNDY